MRASYDAEADAMYIYLNDRPVDRTVRVTSRVAVDLDADGNLRRVEILFVSKALVGKALVGTDFSHIHLELPHVGEVDLRLPVAAA